MSKMNHALIAKRCRNNLLVLSFAFFFNFSSFKTLAATQGSFNKTVGTISLSCMYVTFVFAAFFLSPLVIHKFGCKRTLIFGFCMYATFTLANFYSKVYTLVPAAILAGLGGGLVYPSAVYYVNILARVSVGENKEKSFSKTTSWFLGIFFMIRNLCYLFGSICMSIVVQLNFDQNLYNNEEQNLTSIAAHAEKQNASLPKNNIKNETAFCGLYYEPNASNTEGKNLDALTKYILFSVFVIWNLNSLVLTSCLDDEKTLLIDIDCVKNYEAPDTKEESISIKDDSSINEDVKLKLQKHSGLQKLASSIRLLQSNIFAVLLILFTFHYGLIEQFVASTFNAAWITCYLDVKFVAYTTIAYRAVLSSGSFVFGRLVRRISHAKMFTVVAIFETGLLLFLLLWQPMYHSTEWAYFFLSMGFAVCHSSQSGQLASVYSRFFRDKEASSALLFVWDPLGSATSYAVASLQPPVAMVILMMCVTLIGTSLYLIAEWKLKQTKNKESTLEVVPSLDRKTLCE